MSEPSIINKAITAVGNMSLSRVALFAAILTAGYYVMFYNNGDEVLQSIEAAKAQLEDENNKKVETQKVLKKEQQMKADVELFAKKFEEIKAKIPLEFLESELRSIVDKFSIQNGLKTTKSDRRQQMIRPQQTSDDSLIDQVGLNYEFQGSYASICKFVSDLSSVEKLIKIGDFKLTDESSSTFNSTTKSKNKIKELSFRVSIIGYKQSLDAMKNNKEDKQGKK